ncbi:probable chitinase 10 [Thrips palmi]|uniref:Probable chitinase 10 n=1 Tax=Thrips palmi TaxID=161013 RepID=A0A6P9AN06_THRPL|nr:probable chitinase 10 [Thrips palmi]
MTGHLLVTLCLLVAAASALPGGLLPRRGSWAVVEPTTETPYTKPTDIPPTMPASCAERPEKNDYLMIIDPITCTRFIVCDGPRETVMSCPAGLYFNYEKQYCDWPELSHCDPRPGLPSTTTEYVTVTPEPDVTRPPRTPPTPADTPSEDTPSDDTTPEDTTYIIASSASEE